MKVEYMRYKGGGEWEDVASDDFRFEPGTHHRMQILDEHDEWDRTVVDVITDSDRWVSIKAVGEFSQTVITLEPSQARWFIEALTAAVGFCAEATA